MRLMWEPSKYCPVCAIIDQRTTVGLVRQWPDAVAWEPVKPVAEGHLVLAARLHVVDALESPPLTGLLAQRAAELARENCSDRDYSIAINIGSAAGQKIPHVTMNLVPRWHGDGVCMPDDCRAMERHELRTLEGE